MIEENNTYKIKQTTGVNGEHITIYVNSNMLEIHDVDSWGNIDNNIVFESVEQLDTFIESLIEMQERFIKLTKGNK